MIEVDEEITIDARPAEVFDFIADPTNHEVFTPSIVAVTDVEEHDVGKRGAYEFEMVGVTTEGRFRDVTFERPIERSYELEGDIAGTVTWTIEAVDGGCRVRYQSSLEFPGPDIVETVAEPVLRRFSENEVESALTQLRIVMEEGKATT